MNKSSRTLRQVFILVLVFALPMVSAAEQGHDDRTRTVRASDILSVYVGYFVGEQMDNLVAASDSLPLTGDGDKGALDLQGNAWLLDVFRAAVEFRYGNRADTEKRLSAMFRLAEMCLAQSNASGRWSDDLTVDARLLTAIMASVSAGLCYANDSWTSGGEIRKLLGQGRKLRNDLIRILRAGATPYGTKSKQLVAGFDDTVDMRKLDSCLALLWLVETWREFMAEADRRAVLPEFNDLEMSIDDYMITNATVDGAIDVALLRDPRFLWLYPIAYQLRLADISTRSKRKSTSKDMYSLVNEASVVWRKECPNFAEMDLKDVRIPRVTHETRYVIWKHSLALRHAVGLTDIQFASRQEAFSEMMEVCRQIQLRNGQFMQPKRIADGIKARLNGKVQEGEKLLSLYLLMVHNFHGEPYR